MLIYTLTTLRIIIVMTITAIKHSNNNKIIKSIVITKIIIIRIRI